MTRKGLEVTPAGTSYENVIAGQTAQVLGPSNIAGTGGAKGDLLARVVITPTTTSPGVVTIIDGSTSITIFDGGASSLTELKPIVVELGLEAVNGSWAITTGANIRALCVGTFS